MGDGPGVVLEGAQGKKVKVVWRHKRYFYRYKYHYFYHYKYRYLYHYKCRYLSTIFPMMVAWRRAGRGPDPRGIS